MEIDIREVPEGDRLSRALEAIQSLPRDEVLTLITAEDPLPLQMDIKATLGDDVDVQRHRWAGKEISWRLHVKRSRMPSAYQPE